VKQTKAQIKSLWHWLGLKEQQEPRNQRFWSSSLLDSRRYSPSEHKPCIRVENTQVQKTRDMVSVELFTGQDHSESREEVNEPSAGREREERGGGTRRVW